MVRRAGAGADEDGEVFANKDEKVFLGTEDPLMEVKRQQHLLP